MTASTSPITPSVLEWAVTEDGRTPEELADSLEIPAEVLYAWLSGDDRPTRGQLTKLAELLRRPRAMFLLPRPPSSASLPTAFRRAAGSQSAVTLQARKKVRESRQIQKAMAWIRRDEPAVSLPNASLVDGPESAAAAVRDWLAIASDVQAKWKTDREALLAWREALEDRGVLVFALQIGRDEIRGFSDWDDHAPVIAVNTSGYEPAPRMFSIAHELGHLALRADSTCVPFDRDGVGQSKVERWCESFGAALLMPSEAVRRFIAARNVAIGRADLSDVKAMTLRFRVSARAAAIRLADLGLAPATLYAQVLQAFVPRPRNSNSSPRSDPRPVARIRQYGPEVVGAVLSSLPQRDALNVLRIDATDARQIALEMPVVSGY